MELVVGEHIVACEVGDAFVEFDDTFLRGTEHVPRVPINPLNVVWKRLEQCVTLYFLEACTCVPVHVQWHIEM